MREQLLPRFDPFDIGREVNPYLTFARLRAAGPLLRGGPGVFVVPRYREVVALLREPRLGGFRFQVPNHPLANAQLQSSLGDGPARAFLERIVVASDGPDHLRLRKAMGD